MPARKIITVYVTGANVGKRLAIMWQVPVIKNQITIFAFSQCSQAKLLRALSPMPASKITKLATPTSAVKARERFCKNKLTAASDKKIKIESKWINLYTSYEIIY